MTTRNRILLWALRSPCNLGCKYCYFGTIEEHRDQPPVHSGQLSHLSRTDISAQEALRFAATLRDSAVKRVFLAGGEPLIWPHTLAVIAAIGDAGVEVVVCTNGTPLNKPDVVSGLLDAGVHAVSVSLDSTDPQYNDAWRPARNGKDGHAAVLSGIRALLAARGPATRPRVGLYSVTTRQNLADVTAVPQLAADLGCDYAVPQPISLDPGHDLHNELALTAEHAAAVDAAYAALYDAPPSTVRLPRPTFRGQVSAAIHTPTSRVRGCFGGHTLNFIEPDGSIWDCPSALRIRETPLAARRTIVGHSATDLFPAPRGCAQDCGLFSVDCVNMWPLMHDFDSVPAEASS
jgi:MoaA/NifB/PqqE/SkfB family radical SAM enzyme